MWSVSSAGYTSEPDPQSEAVENLYEHHVSSVPVEEKYETPTTVAEGTKMLSSKWDSYYVCSLLGHWIGYSKVMGLTSSPVGK